VLLAWEGYLVDGVDFSPDMIRVAERKVTGLVGVTLLVADAADPPVEHGAYGVVLCRHVLWAMPDPGMALKNWIRLLRPRGTLVLIEGRWSNEVGLTAEETLELVRATSRTAHPTRLGDAMYWGRSITDDRYLVASPPSEA
jgi:ubiquinone/menaquinone biosynthesis C-methylase UbiE